MQTKEICEESIIKNLIMDILTILHVILLVENHCRPTNPCKNDGLCVEMEDGYKCRCKGGYKGVDCEGKVFLKPHICWVYFS